MEEGEEGEKEGAPAPQGGLLPDCMVSTVRIMDTDLYGQRIHTQKCCLSLYYKQYLDVRLLLTDRPALWHQLVWRIVTLMLQTMNASNRELHASMT